MHRNSSITACRQSSWPSLRFKPLTHRLTMAGVPKDEIQEQGGNPKLEQGVF